MVDDVAFKLSSKSKQKLAQGHVDIQAVVMLAITYTKIDFGVIQCERDIEEQKLLFVQDKTKTLKSKHLPCFVAHGVRGQKLPSIYKPGAVDLLAYVDGQGTWGAENYPEINKAMQKAAEELGISIRWGGDWDSDGDTTDQTFNDLVHWELTGDKYTITFDHLYPDGIQSV